MDGEVQASYSGGRVKRGSLTGQIIGDELRHRYTQTLNDGRRQSGRATVKIQRRTDGRLELIDEWAWQNQSEEAQCLMVERKNNE